MQTLAIGIGSKTANIENKRKIVINATTGTIAKSGMDEGGRWKRVARRQFADRTR